VQGDLADAVVALIDQQQELVRRVQRQILALHGKQPLT
jgi:hypothetical protein